MNRDDIRRMAREAWLMDKHDCSDDWFIRGDAGIENLERFAALVAGAEREACARIAEGWLGPTKHMELHIAAAIRGRDNA